MGQHVGAIIASGYLQDGDFVPVRAAYWRVVTHEDGGMVSLAPVRVGGTGEPPPGDGEVVTFQPDESFIEVLQRLAETRSRLLRDLFGLVDPNVEVTGSIGAD